MNTNKHSKNSIITCPSHLGNKCNTEQGIILNIGEFMIFCNKQITMEQSHTYNHKISYRQVFGEKNSRKKSMFCKLWNSFYLKIKFNHQVDFDQDSGHIPSSDQLKSLHHLFMIILVKSQCDLKKK